MRALALAAVLSAGAAACPAGPPPPGDPPPPIWSAWQKLTPPSVFTYGSPSVHRSFDSAGPLNYIQFTYDFVRVESASGSSDPAPAPGPDWHPYLDPLGTFPFTASGNWAASNPHPETRFYQWRILIRRNTVTEKWRRTDGNGNVQEVQRTGYGDQVTHPIFRWSLSLSSEWPALEDGPWSWQ
ncbi:MAG: hypothetical protein MH204_06910 [Fimbriimonadaceae bacterium]|nr:hypothetical protein [Fimbriimonadaceae bacterium]